MRSEERRVRSEEVGNGEERARVTYLQAGYVIKFSIHKTNKSLFSNHCKRSEQEVNKRE